MKYNVLFQAVSSEMDTSENKTEVTLKAGQGKMGVHQEAGKVCQGEMLDLQENTGGHD
jgi:hypothetical protein